jgi:protein-L-isoaspartate O-methyltransferase
VCVICSATGYNDLVYIGPYDAIHVGAAAPSLPPALIEQLSKPGRMFIPVGTYMQFIEHVDKDAAGNVSSQKVMGVRVRSIQESFILHLTNDYGFAVCSINRPTQTAREF